MLQNLIFATLGTFSPQLNPGFWQQFKASWSSGSATLATLSIINFNLARSGNDFAIDDLALIATTYANQDIPESSGLFGLLLPITIGFLFTLKQFSRK